MLADLNYYTLIVDRDRKEYSRPTSFKTIHKHWKWEMSSTPGNENRMQFSGSLKEITCLPLDKGSLFDPSLMEALKKLFE